MYSTEQDNINSLESIGFTPSDYIDDYGVVHTTWESPGSNWAGAVVYVHLYLSAAGYYCVAVDEENWRAPIFQSPECLDEFVSWLDKHYPGWR